MRPKDCEKCLLHRSAFIICSVLSVIPIINLLATVASVVLSIIYLVGLYNAGKDINGCANAFVLSIISLVCNIISSLTSFNVLLAMLFSFAAAVLTFMVTYQVCTSVSGGRKPSTQRYRRPWKKHMDCIFDRFYIKCSCCYSGCSDTICGCYHSGNECCLYNDADHCTAFLCDIPKQEFCGSF